MERTGGKWEIEQPCGFPYTGIYIVSHKANNDKGFHSFIVEVRQYRERGEAKANADFICKAVNYHDRLVEIAKEHLDDSTSGAIAAIDGEVSFADPEYWKAKRDRTAALLKELEG